jgi:hypothetical protein
MTAVAQALARHKAAALPTTNAMRFSASARDGEARANEKSAKQAMSSLEMVFMVVLMPEEPMLRAMLRYGH